jgi:hypothetical protein
MYVLVFIIHTNIPIMIGPKGIGLRFVANVVPGINPTCRQSSDGIKERRMMSLSAAAHFPLHRQGTPLHYVLDKAIMTQLVRRLVQGIDDTVSQAETYKSQEDSGDSQIGTLGVQYLLPKSSRI